MKKIVFAESRRDGRFRGLTQLNKDQIIMDNEESNDDGTYEVIYLNDDKEVRYFYYIEKLDVM
jgi:hypothetical protein